MGEYGPVLDKLMIKSEGFQDTDNEELQKKENNNSFELNDISINNLKNGMKRQKPKDDNRNIKMPVMKKKFSYQFQSIWPSSQIRQFYYLYARNILIFQKAFVSIINKTCTVFLHY